jgi:prevent-host-death family protein
VEVNIHQAKTHLSRLLAQVVAGEEVVISRAGKPVARLIPFQEPLKKRILGRGRRLMKVPKNFNKPLPKEILEGFRS